MATYNGWTNRETWLINIWYNPESKNDVDYAREDFEAKLDDLEPMLKDFIDDGVINWDDLKEVFEDED
jgi:hypothetical protein